MKMKVSELSGNKLDLAVAQAEGREVEVGDHPTESGFTALFFKDSDERCNYTDDWAQAGPIIERERIDVNFWAIPVSELDHGCYATKTPHHANGPTPLIAAMRCYVASKLGDEVEVN
jgi:hypothetical protein